MSLFRSIGSRRKDEGGRRSGLSGSPDSGESSDSAPSAARAKTPATAGSATSPNSGLGRKSARPGKRGSAPQNTGDKVAIIGGTIEFKGDLTGDEDLEILGKVEGRVDLPSHQLTIGDGSHVKAEVSAKVVLVLGKVTGNITATERLEVKASGAINGDIRAPRLLVEEGAVVNGGIEMTDRSAKSGSLTPEAPKTAVAGGSGLSS